MPENLYEGPTMSQMTQGTMRGYVVVNAADGGYTMEWYDYDNVRHTSVFTSSASLAERLVSLMEYHEAELRK